MRSASLAFLLVFSLCLLGCAAGYFSRSDSIVVEKMSPSLPYLKVGDVVTIRGRYTLQSEPRAMLVVSLASPDEEWVGSRRSRVAVEAGSDTFELEFRIEQRGLLHLDFFSLHGKSVGRLDVANVGLLRSELPGIMR